MNKAYDAILCVEVDAMNLAKTNFHKDTDYYRYQCLCCGEEVYLAAADSTFKTPHFRHRRGNNDTECEAYLGQPGAIERSLSVRKHNSEQVSFLFNNERKTFEIGVRFQTDELNDLEKRGALLELKRNYLEKPFLTVPINHLAFVPDTVSYFTLNLYSQNYYLVGLSEKKVTQYSNVFEEHGKIYFFKPRIQDERARKVLSDLLYTNTRYIAVCEDKNSIEKMISFSSIKCISAPNEFNTMGKCFYCVEISVLASTYELNRFLSNYGLRVETSETFMPLWPPVFMRDSEYISETEEVFVSSSFPLTVNGNTNVVCQVNELSSGITCMRVLERAVVHEKNIDVSMIRIEKERQRDVQNEIVSITASKWRVPADMEYFLFDQDGCRRLILDENVYLANSDRIAGYRNGHLQLAVLGCTKSSPSKKQIIEDIEKYYPQTETYNPDDFLDLPIDESLIEYMEKCYRNGKINTIVRKYIEEGLL